jgi:hypothetical protein
LLTGLVTIFSSKTPLTITPSVVVALTMLIITPTIPIAATAIIVADDQAVRTDRDHITPAIGAAMTMGSTMETPATAFAGNGGRNGSKCCSGNER